MKKITISFLMLLFVALTLSGIYAAADVSIFDIKNVQSVYKFSEDKDINMPFIRSSLERIIMDKEISKSGLSVSTKNINTTADLKGIQTLISKDTIRVEGNMEYGVFIASTVIIEGEIDKTILVIAENLIIAKDATIKEDILVITRDLDLKGNVEGSLIGTIDKLNHEGKIAQDLRAYIGSIKIDDSSNISGNIYLKSYNNIQLGDKYSNANIELLQTPKWYELIYLDKIIISSIIFALLFILITNKTNIINKMLDKTKSNKQAIVLYGAISIIAAPIIFLALFISLYLRVEMIGFAIVSIYAVFILVIAMLSTFIIGSLISEYITKKYNKDLGFIYNFISSACIFVILSLALKLPHVGEILGMIMFILASGTVLTTLFKKSR